MADGAERAGSFRKLTLTRKQTPTTRECGEPSAASTPSVAQTHRRSCNALDKDRRDGVCAHNAVCATQGKGKRPFSSGQDTMLMAHAIWSGNRQNVAYHVTAALSTGPHHVVSGFEGTTPVKDEN